MKEKHFTVRVSVTQRFSRLIDHASVETANGMIPAGIPLQKINTRRKKIAY